MWNFIEASFASSRLWSDGAFEVPMLREQVVMRVSHANRLMKLRAVSATSRHPSSSCSCLVTVVIASPSTLQARSTHSPTQGCTSSSRPRNSGSPSPHVEVPVVHHARAHRELAAITS